MITTSEITLPIILRELEAMASAGGDAEINHSRADDLLCEALRQLGWSPIADAFSAARKEFWYA